MIKVAFFDAKAYDKPSFERYGSEHDMQFRFLETKLNEDTVELARGCDAVCVFVNDTVNAAAIDKLYAMGVKLIALRSAGYNNVDVQAAFGKILEIGSGIQVWVDVDVDRRHIVARRQCLQDETCFTDAASAGDNHKTTDGFVLHGGAESLQLKELAFATEERIFGSSRHLTPKNA